MRGSEGVITRTHAHHRLHVVQHRRSGSMEPSCCRFAAVGARAGPTPHSGSLDYPPHCGWAWLAGPSGPRVGILGAAPGSFSVRGAAGPGGTACAAPQVNNLGSLL